MGHGAFHCRLAKFTLALKLAVHCTWLKVTVYHTGVWCPCYCGMPPSFLIVFCDLQDTAASYGVGAAGSLFYLRMLNRSIDSVGGFTVGAALGQPRLLVPIILTAAFNR